MTTTETKALINHITLMLDYAKGTGYEDGYKRVLAALQEGDLESAQNLASDMISGAEEDLAWDQQVTTLLNAMDGTLERLGLPIEVVLA